MVVRLPTLEQIDDLGSDFGLVLSADEISAIRARVTADLDEAVAFAEASPFPDPKDLLVDMFAE